MFQAACHPRRRRIQEGPRDAAGKGRCVRCSAVQGKEGDVQCTAERTVGAGRSNPMKPAYPTRALMPRQAEEIRIDGGGNNVVTSTSKSSAWALTSSPRLQGLAQMQNRGGRQAEPGVGRDTTRPPGGPVRKRAATLPQLQQGTPRIFSSSILLDPPHIEQRGGHVAAVAGPGAHRPYRAGPPYDTSRWTPLWFCVATPCRQRTLAASFCGGVQ